MKRAAPLLLLLAACRSSPPTHRADHTIYGDAPRQESWIAYAVEGAHDHATAPGPCLSEFARSERFPGFGNSVCSLLGKARGGPRRLVLLLLSPDDETLAVDVPRLAPEETERTFAPPDVAVELERAGATAAAIDRGRVTLRRISATRYDVEVFAVLKGGTQVVARAQADAAP